MISHLSHTAQAIILAVFGYSIFSIADAFAKHLTNIFAVTNVLLLGSTIGLIFCIIWLQATHGFKVLKTPKLKLLIIRGVLVASIAQFVVHAFHLMPLADFYSIAFMSPFISTILAAIFLKEKLLSHRVWAIIFGFVGVITLIGPQFHTINHGVIFAFCGMLIASVNVLLVRKIGPSAPGPLFAFFPFLFIALFNLPMADYAQIQTIMDVKLAGLFLIYGALVFIGQFVLPVAFAKAPAASVVAPFHYIQIIWGVLFGILLFNNFPTWATLSGGTIIVLAGLYMIYFERKVKHH